MEQPILVQGAMGCELAFLQKQLANPREIKIGPYVFFQGTFSNQPVVLSRLQIGFAHTAAATVLAIHTFDPKIIINQGTAGGYREDLHNYDIVVGERYFNGGAIFTEGQTEKNTSEKLPWKFLHLGSLERAESFDQCVSERPFYSYCDEKLVAKVMKKATNYTKGKIVKGTIASAEEWNSDPVYLRLICKVTGADCEEMEAAAAGKIAAAYNLPFISIKIISNNNVTGQPFDPQTAVALQEFIWGLFK